MIAPAIIVVVTVALVLWASPTVATYGFKESFRRAIDFGSISIYKWTIATEEQGYGKAVH